MRRPNVWTWVVGVFLVVGVILILPLLPSGPHEHRTQCLSNVKQLGVALSSYCEDWDGFYPIEDWQTSVGKYVKDPSIHTCPDVLERGGQFGYAMNWVLLGRASEQVADPETIPIVFETDALGMNVAANFAAVAKDRHKGGSFVCFADTHAAWRKKESWR